MGMALVLASGPPRGGWGARHHAYSAYVTAAIRPEEGKRPQHTADKTPGS